MKRPHVLIKTAMSLNGKIGFLANRRIIFSNQKDTQAVDALRARCDAILVGETTLKKDNPRLTLKFAKHVRERLKRGLPQQPAKVTLSKLCDLDTRSNFFTPTPESPVRKRGNEWSEIPKGIPKSRGRKPVVWGFTTGNGEKFVFTTSLAPEKNVKRISAYARVFRVGAKRVDIKKMLAILYQHGIRKLMVEGGGRINYEFLKSGCVDEMRIAITPKIIGDKNAPSFAYGDDFLRAQFHLKTAERLKNMAILHYIRS